MKSWVGEKRGRKKSCKLFPYFEQPRSSQWNELFINSNIGILEAFASILNIAGHIPLDKPTRQYTYTVCTINTGQELSLWVLLKYIM